MRRKTKERHQSGNGPIKNKGQENGKTDQYHQALVKQKFICDRPDCRMKFDDSNQFNEHLRMHDVNASMFADTSKNGTKGSDRNGGGKFVAKLEMTIMAGNGGCVTATTATTVLKNGRQHSGSSGFVAIEEGKSKSSSPIALHQRCGIPAPTQNGDVVAHSTKSVKQDMSSSSMKTVNTTVTSGSGRMGSMPIRITVRASNGGSSGRNCMHQNGGEMTGDGEGCSCSARDKSSTAHIENGIEDGGGGGGSNADASHLNGTVEIEEPAESGQPALVKIQARKVNCKTSDGEIFVVDWFLMQQSKLFKRHWEEHRQAQKRKSGNGRSRKFTFNMETVDSATFRQILEWLVQHDGMDEPVVREDPMTGDRIWFELTEFERRFFDQPLCIMNSLLTAGKYLDIPSLYLFGCQTMAGMLQSKSAAEIRELLGLPDDLSSTEIVAIRRRNRKFRMREMKAARYANRLQQLQSQLNQMGMKNGNNNGGGKQGGKLGGCGGGAGVQQQNNNQIGQVMAEQLLYATGRDILTEK